MQPTNKSASFIVILGIVWILAGLLLYWFSGLGPIYVVRGIAAVLTGSLLYVVCKIVKNLYVGMILSGLVLSVGGVLFWNTEIHNTSLGDYLLFCGIGVIIWGSLGLLIKLFRQREG